VTSRLVVPREIAQQDIDAAIAHYQAEGGEPLALRFIDTLQKAFRRLGTQPGVGSLRYAYELGLDGLRACPPRPHRLHSAGAGMSKPEFITNQDGNTLLAALQAAIPDAPAMLAPGVAEAPLALTEISIATAFMSPAGFGAVAERLDQAGHVRLLIGAEPEPEAKRLPRKPGDPPQAAFERREVAEGLKLLEAGLRRERDRQPFSAEARRHLRGMVRMLRAGKLETRRYERAFLHAKATLLDGLAPGLIAGSSNLTRAGLTTNLELNLGRWDPALFAQAKA
jgi:plasmid stabilization system protein ParE